MPIINIKYLDVDAGDEFFLCQWLLMEDSRWQFMVRHPETGGASMYNGKTFMYFTEKEGLSNNEVRSILEDSQGNLWFGTYGRRGEHV